MSVGAAAIILVIVAAAVVATLVLRWGDRMNRTDPVEPEQLDPVEPERRRRDDR